jgi:hypothetical protein
MLQCEFFTRLVLGTVDWLGFVHLRARHSLHHFRHRRLNSFRTHIRGHGDSGGQNRQNQYAGYQSTKGCKEMAHYVLGIICGASVFGILIDAQELRYDFLV